MSSPSNNLPNMVSIGVKVLLQNGPRVFAAKAFKKVFENTLFFKVARVLWYEGPIILGGKVYRRSLSFLKYKLSRLHNPTFQLEDMTFNLKAPFPKFSIVSVLYNKENEVNYFLQSIADQNYEGSYEVILVDDCSPGNDVRKVETFKNKIESTGKKFDLRILKNEDNSGNCISRLNGINAATGDIVVIIDADCVLNHNFMSAHAEAHQTGDCDVAIGPMNIETVNEKPLKMRDRLERDFSFVFEKMQLQDNTNWPSFINCVTRNFSIRRSFIKEPLFDKQFSYSKKLDSGFGWEDTEMGYRLYKMGAKIKFVNKSFTLHVSHPDSIDSREKPLKSIKNFRRVFEKHPELANICRRWTLETYQRICSWMDNYDLSDAEDKKALDVRFKQYQRYILPKQRPLRILTYRWHVPHQYELYKLPHQFTLATGIVNNFTTSWSYGQRPMPLNANFKDISKIKERNYDLAIIHFDENVLDWKNTNGVLDSSWGAAFKYFVEELNLPKIALCHGTPQFYGQYKTPNVPAEKIMQPIEESRLKLVNYLKDITVICNSYQAKEEWQFKKSKTIWQGFDPAECYPALYNKGILSLGNAMSERPHYRGQEIYERATKDFPKNWQPVPFKVVEPNYQKDTNRYAWAKYRNYIDAVRDYSIYFNPTIRSPMPRSRGEAMMCGLTSVSYLNHDVDLFIKNGVNGFYSSNPEELREYLIYLLKNPEINKKIGMEGRKTSCDIFNHDRYLSEWIRTINENL